MPMAPLTTKDMQDIGHAMAHSYNTRLRKSRDGNQMRNRCLILGKLLGSSDIWMFNAKTKVVRRKQKRNLKLNQVATLIWS